MNTNIYAVILAGGHGTRMGNVERPKQFLDIADKPIIIHTIEKIVLCPDFEKVIVLVPEAWQSHTNDISKKYLTPTLRERIDIIEGGDERHGTIMNALNHIEERYGIDDETIVLTHDAVRPFVSNRIIKENIESAKEYGACDTVIPASDTIVKSEGGEFIDSIPTRANMYQGQTPQTFRGKKLKYIYNQLSEVERANLTDACKIFIYKGEKVRLVEGDVSNIKITYPADLRIAKSLIGDNKC